MTSREPWTPARLRAPDRASLRGGVARVLLALVAAAFASGCFPYRQSYRHAMTGVVVDASQRPVAGATVVVCTTDGWGAMHGCPRRAETHSSDDGAFSLPAVTEWDWCCFGEAPRPQSFLTSCAWDKDGQLMTAPTAPVSDSPGSSQRVQVAPARDRGPLRLCTEAATR